MNLLLKKILPIIAKHCKCIQEKYLMKTHNSTQMFMVTLFLCVNLLENYWYKLFEVMRFTFFLNIMNIFDKMLSKIINYHNNRYT